MSKRTNFRIPSNFDIPKKSLSEIESLLFCCIDPLPETPLKFSKRRIFKHTYSTWLAVCLKPLYSDFCYVRAPARRVWAQCKYHRALATLMLTKTYVEWCWYLQNYRQKCETRAERAIEKLSNIFEYWMFRGNEGRHLLGSWNYRKNISLGGWRKDAQAFVSTWYKTAENNIENSPYQIKKSVVTRIKAADTLYSTFSLTFDNWPRFKAYLDVTAKSIERS